MAIVFKAIKPDRFKDIVIYEEILNAMDDTGDDIKKDFEKTTATWQHKPDFEIISEIGPKGPEVLVDTNDKIYGFVSEGTAVRYATMTEDFQAKTMPNVIGSRAGQGGLLYVNKNRPRPGIEARNFDKIIQKKWQPRFKRRMEAALKRGIKKSGHQT
jgi:hypothetical protein